MREPPRGAADHVRIAPAKNSRWGDYVILFRTPSYVYCTLGGAAMTFAIGGIGFWMPSYLDGRPGSGDSPTTIFGAITVVAGLMATLLGGFAGDRLRGRFPGAYFLVSGAAMLVGFHSSWRSCGLHFRGFGCASFPRSSACPLIHSRLL